MNQKNQNVFCPSCGTQNSINAKFCVHCGKSMEPTEIKSTNIINSANNKLNDWAGNDGSIKVGLKEFFGQVFKKHTEEEAEDIFIVGTNKTTPSLKEVAGDKVQPWIFSRVLVMILIASTLLGILTTFNSRLGIVIAMDTFVAVSVPISALILFFETNVYKNISMYKITQIFIIGGILSLIATMIIDQIIGNNSSLNLFSALSTGFAEETAKIIVAAYFIYKFNINKIFNGLLIGAAVGSGFAAFENIMYMVNDYTGQLVPIKDDLTRSIFSISDHTEWCAIVAAALVIAKGSEKLNLNSFLNHRFIKFFIIVMLIHALWDWNVLSDLGYFRYIILSIVTWVIVFIFIDAGLQQVNKLKESFDISKT